MSRESCSIASHRSLEFHAAYLRQKLRLHWRQMMGVNSLILQLRYEQRVLFLSRSSRSSSAVLQRLSI